NLKSEHPDTIRAKKPSMSDAAVQRNCAMARLRNAIRAEASWTWSVDSTPKQESDLGGIGLLFRSVAGHRSAEALRARIAADDDASLSVDGDLSAIGLPRKIASIPDQWAGSTLAAALTSGAGTEAERATALWFGLSLGVVAVADAAAEAPKSDASATTLDIASLLDGLGSEPADATEESPEAEDTDGGGPVGVEPDSEDQNWVPDKVLLPPEGTAGPAAAA
ncbi:MAG TPA: hypothetical protein DFR83_07825, partial [Deltaproteobacteria bacterium]|nr:hypothetical protein [Deltaproteobacteria bacterium]